VSSRERVQEVKNIGEKLRLPAGQFSYPSLPVQRPWGTYTVLEEGPFYKVKRLEILPGASISLQFHHYRNEHWIVVQGTARVTKGTEEITLQTNESTYVSQGTLHRLANPGHELLEVIEVQTGSYLGEDDIVRYS
jgi:mannose-1-phosphate guanylyltransferase